MDWLKPIGDALPIVLALALVIWMAIVYHGDSRWLRRPEAMDSDGNVKWATKESAGAMQVLILGQNDKLADHEDRITRHEERDTTVLGQINHNLDRLNEKMDDMGPRLIRLEERSRVRRLSDLEIPPA